MARIRYTSRLDQKPPNTGGAVGGSKGRKKPRLHNGEDCVQYLCNKIRAREILDEDQPAEIFARHGGTFGYTIATFRNKLLQARGIISAEKGGCGTDIGKFCYVSLHTKTFDLLMHRFIS